MKKTAAAYAKVNISLDIISRMPDGYHELLMIMQSIELHDVITVRCVPGEGVALKTDLDYLPVDGRNIAAKAALCFYEYTGISGYRTFIHIRKHIPVAAGLGGGSTDGACVLRMLNSMFETGLSAVELEKIGIKVGSDVPFCISGGTKLVSGRGEIISDIAPLPSCHIIICKPPFAFSTPELFKRINCDKIRSRPDTDGIIAALDNNNIGGVGRRMYNVFEDFLPRGLSDIENIKYAMLNHDALGVTMTGSGPSVFGIFDSKAQATKAYEFLRESFDSTFITKPKKEIL
jgi:4-diphosphocytidyl-2-C-methyl-D-erythritol kinase